MRAAELAGAGAGLAPVTDGWFVVNVRVRPDQPVPRRGEPRGIPVLAGECTVVVEDEERSLGPWDFFHAPASTAHGFVGGADGPCVILMTGARTGPGVQYPVSEVAARHGASVATKTSDPSEAYAGAEWFRRDRPVGWAGLPWA